MTPAQIDFLRDFAIDNLPRAQANRKQAHLTGGDLYSILAGSTLMVRGKAGTTAIEYAAAAMLESVCLLQRPLLTPKERDDTLHNLLVAAHDLCLHTGKIISWLAAASLEPPPAQPQPPPAQPLPSIAGKWLSTKEAAEFLGYREQTLRHWSSSQSGPIHPSKLGRYLKWSGDDILAVLSKK